MCTNTFYMSFRQNKLESNDQFSCINLYFVYSASHFFSEQMLFNGVKLEWFETTYKLKPWRGPSIKYVSILEGGGVSEMLTLADIGGGGLFEMLTSANILHNHVYLH